MEQQIGNVSEPLLLPLWTKVDMSTNEKKIKTRKIHTGMSLNGDKCTLKLLYPHSQGVVHQLLMQYKAHHPDRYTEYVGDGSLDVYCADKECFVVNSRSFFLLSYFAELLEPSACEEYLVYDDNPYLDFSKLHLVWQAIEHNFR